MSDKEEQPVTEMTMGGTTTDSEWQRVTTNDNKWLRVTASGKTNENGTIYIEERMIAIFSLTASRDWWLQLEWLNK